MRSLFLVFYREGLNGMVLFWGFAAAVLFVLALVLNPFMLLLFLVVISIIAFGVVRQSIKEVIRGLIIVGILFGLAIGGQLHFSPWRLQFPHAVGCDHHIYREQ